MAANIIEALEEENYQALTSLEIIEESDPRFYEQFYDKGHDLYITPLESANPYGSPRSLDEQKESLQVIVQEILKFWNKPKLSYARNLEKKCELEHEELKIHRIEEFRDGTSVETMHVVRLGEDAFFSWTYMIF